MTRNKFFLTSCLSFGFFLLLFVSEMSVLSFWAMDDVLDTLKSCVQHDIRLVYRMVCHLFSNLMLDQSRFCPGIDSRLHTWHCSAEIIYGDLKCLGSVILVVQLIYLQKSST